MIRYFVVAFGFAFYAFTISQLVDIISQQNFNKSFLMIIDTNKDGIITKKQLSAFQPCPEYSGKKLKKAFGEYGRRADLNDLALDLSQAAIIKSVKKCIGDVETFTDPEHLKHLKKKLIQKEMLETYDLNNDEDITWGEYNIADSSISKELPYARIVFKFFDKNHDWVITSKQLAKAHPADLGSYIGSGGKRKKVKTSKKGTK